MERNDVVGLNNERFITKFYYNSDANQMGENLFKKFNLPEGIVCNINLAKRLYSLVPVLKYFNLNLIFTDVFRPVEMQKFLYEHWQERTGQEPKFSLANIESAPHPRGIAVDAVLADENGEKIPLPSSSIKYQPEQRNPDFDDFAGTPEEQQKKTNRNFLRTLMLCAGISPINKEWFHFQLPESEKYSAISVEEAQKAIPFEYSEGFEHCKYFDIFHEYQNDEFEGKTRYWINSEKYYSQFNLIEKDEFIEKLEKKFR